MPWHPVPATALGAPQCYSWRRKVIAYHTHAQAALDVVKQMAGAGGGQPEEVAQAIAGLLSDKASYMTGSFIKLAGGK